MQRFLLPTLALLLLASGPAGAQSDDAPESWTEAHRSFLQDGPGLLLSQEQIAELAQLDEVGRETFIRTFLETDPIPETPENELAEGIRRRTILARSAFLSASDIRYKVLFVSGQPSERRQIDCGLAFKPLEIWTYPPTTYAGSRAAEAQKVLDPEERSELLEEAKGKLDPWAENPQVVLYLPSPGASYKLWVPFHSKRALYTSEMEYYLTQSQELWRKGRRFDFQTCKEAREVDQATGVEAFWGFSQDRPTRGAISSFVSQPENLAAWARAAAATPLPEGHPELAEAELDFLFPRLRRQRMVTRLMLVLPPETSLEPDEEGKRRVALEGVIETGGEVFEDFRVRFELDEDALGKPIPLAVDRMLRPNGNFVARVIVRDEVSGARSYVSRGFRVPRQPRKEDAATALAALVGKAADQEAQVTGPDTLLLAPIAEGEVTLGLFRAEALVSGDRIAKVVFLVDGVAQLTRARPPFSAEVRLAEQPREQVVRAEGYDKDGELVAADELILNQPRGSFRVRILEPRRGDKISGPVTVRAEVVVPEERRVSEVEIQLDGSTVATLSRPPWVTDLTVPSTEQLSYLTVIARLDDERWAEDVRILNSPEDLEELNVRLVELYTTVTDRTGRLTRGLTVEDFEVFEDKREQEVTKFELVENLPLTLGITIDTSGSMASSLAEAQKAGEEFLEEVLTPRDRCFVVGFSGKVVLRMPPSRDREACTAGLQGLMAQGWTALHDAVVTSLYHMRELSGQRALVLLSDGDDTVSSVDFAEAAEYARRSGVVIFAVGLDVSALSLDVRRKLNRLAEDTGGRTFYISSAEELAGVYGEIEAELRSRYLLAYSPSRGATQEQFREVEVKVKKRGLKARTIRGYYP